MNVRDCCLLGAGMLHLRELQVLCHVCVVERDREVVGNLADYVVQTPTLLQCGLISDQSKKSEL